MNLGQRRYERFMVKNRDIHAKMLLTTNIEISDISSGGACIKATKSLRLGGKHLIKLKTDRSLLPLRCIIRWERLNESIKNVSGEITPVYKAGVAFHDISSDKLVSLKDFIRISGVPADQIAVRGISDKRVSGLRFRILTNKTAVLSYPETYAVKQISLGGILVETNQSIRPESRLPMALFLPKENFAIKFQGRVAFCIEMTDRKPRGFDIGIEFLDISEEDRTKLNNFIGFHYGIENPP